MAKQAKKSAKSSGKSAAANQDQGPFYVGVPNPRNARRNILESAKVTIGILKQYEHLKQIRKQKLQSFKDFDAVVKEIKTGLAKLKKGLPAVPLRQSSGASEKKAASSVASHVAAKAPEHMAVHNEVEKLEHELQRIESKLGNL